MNNWGKANFDEEYLAIYATKKGIINRCPACHKFPSIRLSSELGGWPWTYFLFQRLHTNSADVPPMAGYKHLLVIVEQLSGWLKPF